MMKVAELVAKLQGMRQDATVVISDADTSWLLHVQDVGEEVIDGVPCVTVGGDYDERFAQ